jgi:DNA polymerase elongation subunit (family B)
MICGLYIDGAGTVHIHEREPDGSCRDIRDDAFRPFLWAPIIPQGGGIDPLPLSGEGELRYLLRFDDWSTFKEVSADRSLGGELIKPLEAQYLIHHKARLFSDMTMAALRRVTVGIAMLAEGDESVITALALGGPDGRLELLTGQDASLASEKALLTRFIEHIRELDPDVIEGHDAFATLDTILVRMRHHKLKPLLGRFGFPASVRKSRLRIAERWLDYPRTDIPGRTVFDSSIATQLYDISARELPGYELEDVADYFEIPANDPADASPAAAAAAHARLSRAVADILLPTYFAQAQNIPMPLQEICLRGSSGKVDSLLFERYYHAGHSLPAYPAPVPFEGAFSRSFVTGVYRDVTHYDVASLYPSLLLSMNRAPQGDALNAFIPLLAELRELRLSYKRMAREAANPELRALYGARQQSFKILINSFYGYLGFPQARFADPALAAEVTRRGRELIQNLIARFQSLGCTVLEADTDGIYLTSPAPAADPDVLLARVADLLPEGVSLEFDGRYEAMFCYKAKNYALLEGGHIHLKGSSFRSRGMEPFLKRLTTHLVRWLLGAEKQPCQELVAEYRSRIASGTMDIGELARSEYLSMNPEAYRRKMEEGGKPRRASLEVALRMTPPPVMGSRVAYYILPKEKGQTSDWQRARPLSAYDSSSAPYAPEYYLAKLDDWEERYAAFLNPDSPRQDELSL